MKKVILSVLLLAATLLGLREISKTRDAAAPEALTTQETSSVKLLSATGLPDNGIRAPVLTEENKNDKTLDVLVLGSRNTLTLRGPIMDESISKLQMQLLDMSSKLSDSDTIYLVIDSPGGSITSGNRFIESAQALPQKVKTISLFSASMAFHTVQSLDERLIVPSGTLMSHQATLGGMDGEIGSDGKGQFVSRVNWILKDLQLMDLRAAKRMGMELAPYQQMIKPEYWVNGQDAVTQKAADRVVLARCGKDLLQGVDNVKMTVFIFKVNLQYSKCPLISYPLKIELEQNAAATPLQREQALQFVEYMISNKEQFVKTYMVNGEYRKVLNIKQP